PYGNGTAIFTNDGGAARRFMRDVEVGMVGVNVPIPVPVAYHSFGGWKASMSGDAKAYGPHGVEFYTRDKTITSRWLHPSHGGINRGYPQNSWGSCRPGTGRRQPCADQPAGGTTTARWRLLGSCHPAATSSSG